MKKKETALLRVASDDSPRRPETEPALSEAEEIAISVVAILDKLAESIPGLRPPNPEEARRARGGRTVSRQFILSAMAMVDASAGVRAVAPKIDTARTRRIVQARDARRVISERLAMLLATVNHTMETEWAEAAGSAMHAYRMANALVSSGNHDELIPHVETLRRHLGRTSGPKPKKKGKKDEK